MKYLKNFESYSASPEVKPAPVKPGTKPNTKPNRPSPIRRDKPSVEPAPKANLDNKEKKRLRKKYRPLNASAEDVVNRYFDESNINNDLK
jgi:hypothetical protein